jgi:Zn-dependent peptidase ImmA (M78 family)
MCGTSEDRTAQLILNAFEVKKCPIDVFELAHMLEVNVRLADITDEGLLHFIEGIPTIFVRYNAPNTHKRFTIAHELGHLFLHSNENMLNIYFRDTSYSVSNDMEQQANRFAANILIPEFELIALIKQGKTKEQMANYFDVSQGVLDWQIFDLS